MAITVRIARLEDAHDFGRVHTESWQAAYRGLMPDDFLDNISVEDRVEAIRAVIERNPEPDEGRRLVAELDGEIVGIALLWAERSGETDTGEVILLYLVPAAWDRGVGSALMDRCVEEMHTIGYREAVLWVAEENPRARTFYERKGWHADGGRKVEDLGGSGEIAEARYRRTL